MASSKMIPAGRPSANSRPIDKIGIGCWRYGSGKNARLIMRVGGSTPDRCVRCNAPAHGYRKTKRFREQMNGGHFNGSAGDGVIGGVILAAQVTAIAADLATRNSAVVNVAICPECRRRALLAKWCTPMLVVAAAIPIVEGIILATDNRGHAGAGAALLAGGVGLLCAALWWALNAIPLLAVEHIANGEIWFLPPRSEAFVNSLPDRMAAPPPASQPPPAEAAVSAPPAPPRSSPAASSSRRPPSPQWP